MNLIDKWLPVECFDPYVSMRDTIRENRDKIILTRDLPILEFEKHLWDSVPDDEFHRYDDSGFVALYNQDRIKGHTYEPYPGATDSLWATRANEAMAAKANQNFRNR